MPLEQVQQQQQQPLEQVQQQMEQHVVRPKEEPQQQQQQHQQQVVPVAAASPTLPPNAEPVILAPGREQIGENMSTISKNKSPFQKMRPFFNIETRS